MESHQTKTGSRRSHTNLSDLRLGPLTTDFTPDFDFQAHHSSYIQGRSAPSTPGILARNSSRRQLGAGLSRKISPYDTHTPKYAAVEVTHDGVPLNALRPEGKIGTMPKAKSEAALLVQQRRTHPRHTQAQLSLHSGASRHHQRSHTGGRPHYINIKDANNDDGWLTRTGLATTTILRESKGQSWLVSSHSSTSLAPDHSNLDSDSDDYDDAYTHMSSSSHQRLHFADDELSPETTRYASRWGSRFGSRAASARNSRRGSVDLARTPTGTVVQDGYFDGHVLAQHGQHEDAVKPDFVDVDDEDEDEEDAEEEISRLARERSFGFGGLVDRLVGWTLFSVDEDREATDVEDDDHGREQKTSGGSDGTVKTPASRDAQTRTQIVREQPRTEGQEEEGGWQDAAWLLSLASKVIL